jgi:peptide/nickel transport system permease protein
LASITAALVVIELIFNYNGLGKTLFEAAQRKDLPVLETGVLVVGIVYLTATLIADILYSVLNPRVRLGSEA